MAVVLKPPASLELVADYPGGVVFLAGSIEMGAAEPWQAAVEDALGDADALLLNPRRDDWDSGWAQEASHPAFHAQVSWELEGLERADVVALYLAPGTKSPISLLELGLLARSGRLVVCCPEGFWRKGNVDVVCERYGVPRVATLEALIEALRRRLRAS